MRKILASQVVGTRKIAGTWWPIEDLLVRVRDQVPGRRPTWEVVRNLCNGVPDAVEVYPTRREVVLVFGGPSMLRRSSIRKRVAKVWGPFPRKAE